MNVCISGGLGFIGSRLARSYAERGDTVVVLDNLHPQIHAHPQAAIDEVGRYAKIVIGDVRNPADWDAALSSADIVLHMAAETGTGQSMDKVVDYCTTNVVGTAQLAEAVARHDRVRLVFLPSSRAIYGEGLYTCAAHGCIVPERRTNRQMESGDFGLRCPLCGVTASPLPTPETFGAQPVSVYASTKLAQEHILNQTCENLRRELRVARYQNVYGPGQSLNNPYTGVLAIFSAQIASGKTLDIYEDGKIVRDFVYVQDVVEATMRLIDLPEDPGTLNIGSGRPSSLFDVVSAFEQAFGKRVSFEVTGHFRYGDIRYAVADTSRAGGQGIRPSVELGEGISRLVNWTRQERDRSTIAT